MNLKTNLSLGSKAAVYPSKTDINLIKTDATKANTLTTVLIFLIFLVLLAIFTKFAVIDPLSSGMNSSREVEAAQADLNALLASNKAYEELSEQYAHYIVAGLTEEEESLADRNDVIDLLESKIMGITNLSSIKVLGNKVSVTCVGIDLQMVSSLVQSIEQDDRVSYVTVSTAQERDGKASTATIDIIMKSAGEVSESSATASDSAGVATNNEGDSSTSSSEEGANNG